MKTRQINYIVHESERRDLLAKMSEETLIEEIEEFLEIDTELYGETGREHFDEDKKEHSHAKGIALFGTGSIVQYHEIRTELQGRGKDVTRYDERFMHNFRKTNTYLDELKQVLQLKPEQIKLAVPAEPPK